MKLNKAICINKCQRKTMEMTVEDKNIEAVLCPYQDCKYKLEHAVSDNTKKMQIVPVLINTWANQKRTNHETG